MTIQIRPIRDSDLDGATFVIISVAHRLFAPDVTFESFRDVFFSVDGELADVTNHAEVYAAPDGLFLVAEDNGTIVGTGAVRRADVQTAEIKRMWLLEDYHGQGIGFEMIRQLLDFARDHGYQQVMLTTSQMQTRAIAFYGRVGFQQVVMRPEQPIHGEVYEVRMEMPLD